MLLGQCLNWTISDVSISVLVRMEVNIGEQREFRLASCPENRSRCSYLSICHNIVDCDIVQSGSVVNAYMY